MIGIAKAVFIICVTYIAFRTQSMNFLWLFALLLFDWEP